MQEIVNLLPVLLVSVTMNLLAGLYYNIGTNDIKFDKAILIKGVIKAFKCYWNRAKAYNAGCYYIIYDQSINIFGKNPWC